MSDNLDSTEPTVEQLAAANAALLAGPQPTAPVVVEAPAVVEAPVVVEAPATAPATVVDEKVDFWANSWFSRNKQ